LWWFKCPLDCIFHAYPLYPADNLQARQFRVIVTAFGSFDFAHQESPPFFSHPPEVPFFFFCLKPTLINTLQLQSIRLQHCGIARTIFFLLDLTPRPHLVLQPYIPDKRPFPHPPGRSTFTHPTSYFPYPPTHCTSTHLLNPNPPPPPPHTTHPPPLYQRTPHHPPNSASLKQESRSRILTPFFFSDFSIPFFLIYLPTPPQSRLPCSFV